MKTKEFNARYFKKSFTASNQATYTGAGTDEFYTVTISNGNKKLLPNENVKYIIFNLLAVVTCPYRTAHCEQFCYAKKAETGPRAKSVVPCRSANYEASKTTGFVPAMISLIEDTIKKPSYKDGKKIVIRIHESGDFYSQEYFNKWLEIANHFKNNNKLVFVAYTKSVDFIHDVPANMVIRFSIWDDTEPAAIEKANALNLPIYTAVETFTDEPKRMQCDCVNCSTCFKCYNAKFELLKCEIH